MSHSRSRSIRAIAIEPNNRDRAKQSRSSRTIAIEPNNRDRAEQSGSRAAHSLALQYTSIHNSHECRIAFLCLRLHGVPGFSSYGWLASAGVASKSCDWKLLQNYCVGQKAPYVAYRVLDNRTTHQFTVV